MSIWNLSLLIGALIATGFAYRIPHAVLWIFIGAVDYTVSVIYWHTGLPYAEAVAGMCDAGVCLSIYFVYRERWELGVYRLFQISLAVNIFFLAGNLGITARIDQDTYASILEVLNWLTLLLIGGMGVAQWVGTPIAAAHRPISRLGHSFLALRAGRKAPAFHRLR